MVCLRPSLSAHPGRLQAILTAPGQTIPLSRPLRVTLVLERTMAGPRCGAIWGSRAWASCDAKWSGIECDSISVIHLVVSILMCNCCVHECIPQVLHHILLRSTATVKCKNLETEKPCDAPIMWVIPSSHPPYSGYPDPASSPPPLPPSQSTCPPKASPPTDW